MQVKLNAMFSKLPVLYTTADLPCFVPKAACPRRLTMGIPKPSLAVCKHLRRVAAFTGTRACFEIGAIVITPHE